MPRTIHASVTVEGDADVLEQFRRRVNALLDESFGEPYRELHTRGRLDYRLKAKGGLPYPPFVEASGEFPDLVLEVCWEDASGTEKGATTLQGGKLTARTIEPTGAGSTSGCALRVEKNGALALGAACRLAAPGEWIGYVVSADRHAFFSFRAEDGRRELVTSDGVEPEWASRWILTGGDAAQVRIDPPEPIDPDTLAALDRIANDFADEWLWFDESPEDVQAVERHRYALYGYSAGAANVRAEKIRTGMQDTPEGGRVFTRLDAGGTEALAALARCWLPARRH